MQETPEQKAERERKASEDAANKTVPQKDFDVLFKKQADTQRQLDAILAKQAEDEKAKLSETERVKAELAEQKAKAERGQKALDAVVALVDAEIKELPENARALVPEGLSPEEKLLQVRKLRASGLLENKPVKKMPDGKPTGTGGREYTAEDLQQLMKNPAEYAKHRDAINAQITANGGVLTK